MLPQCLKNFNVRKCLTFITGMVECLFFAGIVLGWASLGFLFKAQGFFGSFCVNTTNTDGLQVQDCRGQDEQFSLVFTIASFLMNFLTLLNGLIFDRFGTLIARLFGLALHTGGLLMLAFATPTLSMLVYPGLSCIAVGGFMLLLTNMQVANLFGAHRSTIITVYNGAFDSSSGVFLLVKFAYESGISLKASFLFLAAGSIHHLLRTIFLFPRTTIPYPLPDNYKYGISCRRSRKTNGTVETDSKMTMDDNPPDQEELKKTGMSEEEADLNSAIISFFLTSVLALLFSICSSIPVLPLQYFTFVMQMIDFSFLYGGMTVFVAVVFPPCHFGKLYGLITTLSAVFSLLQYACFAVVEELLDGDPLYVNIALTVLILFSFSHPLNVFLHCRKLASQRAKANTSTATKTVTVTEVESMVSLT
ncbi:equilibrative nucleobase transporter 1-like isoform X6 [Corythoichthys intestinalis]|uniref:equilibrative nucleobase transporter 1-like isoform X6 n=1 Tax=Corythoichthys intestinalis TaxID=161448 RepID=UPI0025A4E940|nr:equilibrative nucleobase transporter 1-like isoform X6 [Corythoichthys intestinalis]